MARRKRETLVVALSTALALAACYILYWLVDPLPPRRLVISAGAVGSGYESFAQQYARIVARHGVDLQIRNSAGAVENLDLLRDPTSGVQAALTTFGFTQPADANALYSLGGVLDTAIFVFYRSAESISLFSQFRGKRISIGVPGSALRAVVIEVLKATEALDDSTHLVDLDYQRSLDALISGDIDVAIVPQLDGNPLRALSVPGVRLMDVAQAEAIAKKVPGLKHVVLWRGLLDLAHDIPDSNIDLLASRNRLLVRKELHPALQYLLLEAMREVHSGPGPFNHLGEFPAEQPHDLPLSPTASAFYRSGPTFWQRYTAFWLSSLVTRIVFFVIPVIVLFFPLLGVAPRVYRWLYVRPVNRLHRALASLERQLADAEAKPRIDEYEAQLAEIDFAIRALKVARPFEVDLQRLKIHLWMVREDVDRIAAAT
jgi:hypothetical protein